MSLLQFDAAGKLVLSPYERRMRCLNFTAPVPVAPPRLVKDGCSIAAAFFGMLPRYKKHEGCRVFDSDHPSCQEDLWLAEHVGWPSFIEHVQRPNAAACRFHDVFVHTWSATAERVVRQILKPRAARFGFEAGRNVSNAALLYGWPVSSSPGMFASIEIVLRLKRDAERQARAAYTWVFLSRLDLVWLADVRLSLLNTSLLYLANACQLQPAESGDDPCWSLASAQTHAVDFYFAGSSEIIDLTFLNLTRDIEHFCFTATLDGTGNHKVTNGRLNHYCNAHRA